MAARLFKDLRITLSRPAATLARRALPQVCALCGAAAGSRLVCADCSAALPRVADACPVCALPRVGGTACAGCRTQAPAFAATVAALEYAFPVDHLLQQLKYGGRLANADWAADELSAAVESANRGRDHNEHPQVVAALPLAEPRQVQRGFNQSQEIARRVAGRLGLPLQSLLVRQRHGRPQAALRWSERADNVRGAYAPAPSTDVRGLQIALVDDVMTTGATLAEAAGVLRRAGAARVECWVVARTPPPVPR